MIVDVDGDKTLRIHCRPEGRVNVIIKNQNDGPIENVKAYLIDQDTVISSATSDKEGIIELGAPCGLGKTYTLRTMYNGFKISEEDF